jgi:hypothetical protein
MGGASKNQKNERQSNSRKEPGDQNHPSILADRSYGRKTWFDYVENSTHQGIG